MERTWFPTEFWISHWWHHGKYRLQMRYQQWLQKISSACWYRCNDVRFDPFCSWFKGDVTRAGSDVRKALSSFAVWDFYMTLSKGWYWYFHPMPYGLSPFQWLLCFNGEYVKEKGGWEGGRSTGMMGRTEGWMKVDEDGPPCTKTTCCLSNLLIRLRCEWTWHCDIKAIHSPQGALLLIALTCPSCCIQTQACFSWT